MFQTLNNRPIQIVNIRSEERTSQQTAEERWYRQYLYQWDDWLHWRGYFLRHQPIGRSSQKQEQTISGISQTKSEKYHKEWGKERCQVQFIIFRKHIQLTDRFEPSKESLIIQSNRNIIARHRIGNLIIYMCVIQISLYLHLTECRRPSFNQHQFVTGSLLGT